MPWPTWCPWGSYMIIGAELHRFPIPCDPETHILKTERVRSLQREVQKVVVWIQCGFLPQVPECILHSRYTLLLELPFLFASCTIFFRQYYFPCNCQANTASEVCVFSSWGPNFASKINVLSVPLPARFVRGPVESSHSRSALFAFWNIAFRNLGKH